MKTPLPPHLSFELPSPYEDPIRYDRTYRRRRMDVEFYRSMAKEKGGPVLELGIGTGRIAIPLARDGHLVVGIEKEPAMLERLRLKLRRETREVRLRVRWIAGDFRWMRFPKDGENETPRRFPLVIAPFNVFMHLYTIDDVESTLCAIRECLEPKGILAFDVRMPDMRTFFRNPERRYRCADLRNPQSGERLLVYERFEYDAFWQIQCVTTEYRLKTGALLRTECLVHRQFFPQELLGFLRDAGFQIVGFWGDFDRSPPTIDSPHQVVVAEIK